MLNRRRSVIRAVVTPGTRCALLVHIRAIAEHPFGAPGSAAVGGLVRKCEQRMHCSCTAHDE